MRLTKKMTDEYGYWYESDKHLTDKLGQLEDIEDELGIDLITLFKALKNGIWIYDDGMPFKTSAIKFNNLGFPSLYCKISDIEVLLKDYGKTWALTKEELE